MTRKNKILLIEPPYYRLFKKTYSLDRYPLSLSYIAGIIKKTEWDVLVYNSDFAPNSEMKKVSYETGKGFENYLYNLQNCETSIWHEIKSIIKDR